MGTRTLRDIATLILDTDTRGSSLIGWAARDNLEQALYRAATKTPGVLTEEFVSSINGRIVNGDSRIPGKLRTTTALVGICDAVNRRAGDPVAAGELATELLLKHHPYERGNRRTALVLGLAVSNRHDGYLQSALDQTRARS